MLISSAWITLSVVTSMTFSLNYPWSLNGCCCSVAKLCPTLCNTRLLCPSLSPGVCSDSCPLSQWCCLTISSSATLFSFCPQSFPASGSFAVSQLFTSGGQSIGISASASVFPMNIQSWFPFGLTGLFSLQFKGLSRVFSRTTVRRHQFFKVRQSLIKCRVFHCCILWIWCGIQFL